MGGKGGYRRLRALPARVFLDHRTADAVAHRRFYAVLDEEMPLTTPLLRHEASRVAMLAVIRTNSARALLAAQAQARHSPGHPSRREIERLARRAGLDDGSYSQALDKLRALAGPRKPLDFAQALAAQARAHDLARAHPLPQRQTPAPQEGPRPPRTPTNPSPAPGHDFQVGDPGLDGVPDA
jgi:hypothetical protein